MTPPFIHCLFVLKGWPRLSETFIAREIAGLERHGLHITIASLRQPSDHDIHPVHRRVRAEVMALPEYLTDQPHRVRKSFLIARRLPGYRRARRLFLRDLRRNPTPNRCRRFGQALVLAAELPVGISRIHAHFLHTPASVARYTAAMHRLPWSFSAHAKDIWTTSARELRDKLADADWGTVCHREGWNALHALMPKKANPARLMLVYHGADLTAASPVRHSRRDGSQESDPVRIVSVGRLVEKKGFSDLLAALSSLPPDLSWRFDHVGDGPLAARLHEQARALGLTARITWHGAQTQAGVTEILQSGDVFVLASRIAGNGDRDGLPNVLLEAAAHSLPVAASKVAAIPELIRHGENGLLVPPGDSASMAAVLEKLCCKPALRRTLGEAVRQRVHDAFDAEQCLAPLAERFGLSDDSVAPTTGKAGKPEKDNRMRLAFYAPMKPPDHPVPSGDRRMARLLTGALELAGHTVQVVSRLRSYAGGDTDEDHHRRIAAEAADETARLRQQWQAADRRPQGWFTYHLSWKAPDLLGPALCRDMTIPYLVAEASHAPRRAAAASGWQAQAHDMIRQAVRQARAVFYMTEADRPALESLVVPPARLIHLPPFIDAPDSAPLSRAAARRELNDRFNLNPSLPLLVCVAMMRPGVKHDSYRLLADAVGRLTDGWQLLVAGDGPCREAVAALFSGFGDRVRFAGCLTDADLTALYCGGDVLAWPGRGEAYGMVYLEAAARGLAAVAEDSFGVRAVIDHGTTGLLVPSDDPSAYAAALTDMLQDGDRRDRMGTAARLWAAERSPMQAADILRHTLSWALS